MKTSHYADPSCKGIDGNKKAKGRKEHVVVDTLGLPMAVAVHEEFSHTAMKCILGLKAMFLCYTDGKTQFMLDSTMQAETGKNEERPQGLTKKQKAAQYTKERAEDDQDG